MSDPYKTWLKTRWPKLTSVEAQIAETVWNECERRKDAEIGRLKAELQQSLHELHLRVDHLDWKSIEEAVAQRLSWGTMPDACHDDATMTGRVLAEICRGWIDLHDQNDET